jgi:hypothetical protein
MPNWFGPDPDDCGCCADASCPEEISIEVSGVGGSTGTDCASGITCSDMNATYLVSRPYSEGCVFLESCLGPLLPNFTRMVYTNGIIVSFDSDCLVNITVFSSARPNGGVSQNNLVNYTQFSATASSLSLPHTLTPTATVTGQSYGVVGAYGCQLSTWGSQVSPPNLATTLCDLSSLVVKLV